jgi:hypothetical protein
MLLVALLIVVGVLLLGAGLVIKGLVWLIIVGGIVLLGGLVWGVRRRLTERNRPPS